MPAAKRFRGVTETVKAHKPGGNTKLHEFLERQAIINWNSMTPKARKNAFNNNRDNYIRGFVKTGILSQRKP